MDSGEKDDAVIAFVEAEVKGACALEVGRLERGNGESERERERLAELGDGSIDVHMTLRESRNCPYRY